jgi:hypothetical protein
LTPGSTGNTKHLRSFEIDLPEGAVLYGDKTLGEYFTEDLPAEACKLSSAHSERKTQSSDRLVSILAIAGPS